MQEPAQLPRPVGGGAGKLAEYHLWCRKNSESDERFYRTLDPRLPGNPLRQKPRLSESGRPVLAAYNFLMTWADGNGGVSHDTLEWYLTRGPGAVLAPTTKERIRRGVERLIAQDRRLAAEELERIRRKYDR